jgi:hypothetical protein
MTPLEITIFGVTLFAALVALLQWKYRRTRVASRLNRGLHSYVSAPVDCRSCDPASV